jgi:hypothetical protein
MHMARRFRHGFDLERKLEREVAELSVRHPDGFAVRLHVLGDFYSVQYVRLWASLLDRHPALHAFGFSARHDERDPVARELIALVSCQWSRFAIRLSNAPATKCATISIEHPYQCPPDAVVCPQQVGEKPATCGECALCWHSTRRIAFIQH